MAELRLHGPKQSQKQVLDNIVPKGLDIGLTLALVLLDLHLPMFAVCFQFLAKTSLIIIQTGLKALNSDQLIPRLVYYT